MPMTQNPVEANVPTVGAPAWWHKTAYKYGHGTTPISIAVLANKEIADGGVIGRPDAKAFCGVAVQQSTTDDVGILLGVPPQKV